MNTLYDSAREGFLAGEIVWKVDGSVIKAALLRNYTFSATHKYFSEVTGAGGVIVATATLNSLTNTGGVADAADAAFGSPPESPAAPVIVIYQASAVTGGSDVPASSQRLIVYIDRGPGLPAFPNGQPVTSAWSPGADRIFRI